MANRKSSGHIQTYSRKARDVITGIALNFLSRFGISDISTALFTCVDELVKNAVKANYKFILIHDEIYQRMKQTYINFSDEQIETEIHDILKVQESYDHLANSILSEKNISAEVRRLLNEESCVLNIKNRAYSDNRNITEEEEKIISLYDRISYIKSRGRELGVRIVLKIQSDSDYFYIEITNTAPILTKDLNRIYSKRDEYNRLRSEGRELDFFINNLDTSESGFGLGYATIDSVLCSWGLDPARALTIISSIDTTVLLALPIDELKRSAEIL